ncbi:nucleoside deaminase [Chitinophaga cymbidii]|uniref:tRNA-specific adenosine deaminase n=1 Tax=Chitinophaga cymbidii TaxID=1096750 RepID=A0A512RMW6_9BACT|nr:nucleoside deaminase [Chitinophaga cymbidii]GEP97031.1 tRNA-specific adenosine deaminase [Chitinophaga cymbidii]
MDEHKEYMKRCLTLSQKALDEGESPVGCVIVKDGKIIGEGYEKSRQLKDVTRHAETVAILDALKNTTDLSGAVLYSNVEPCILCSYVIRHHKISEVVFAKTAGELGGTCAPFDILTSATFLSWGPPPKITVYPRS